MVYKGLNEAEVAKSREQHGANILMPPPRTSWWKLFFEKFKDPIIRLLLVAAVLALIVGAFEGSYTEGLGIILAVLLATVIGFVNEYKAGKEFDILNQVNNETAVKVIRNDMPIEIPKTEIVVGDIVLIEQGDEIPADGILLEALSLAVNESTLNGESLPSNKTAEKVTSFQTAYSPNMVLRGTTVSEGQGIMQVTTVGDATEIGKTAREATAMSGEETPLNKQLNRLSKVISKYGTLIAAGTFMLLVLRDVFAGNLQFAWSFSTFSVLLTYFMIAVTLIVMAVPEGLPMSVTMSLAYSMRRMTRTNNLVRKMHACETMGATTIICTDKTGTLTQNKMSVQATFFPQLNNNEISVDEISKLILYASAGNSTAHLDLSHKSALPVGNPTEGALLLWLQEKNINYNDIRQQINIVARSLFTTEKKYMATHLHLPDNSEIAVIKGAPEVILSRCETTSIPEDVQQRLKIYQNRAMRTLAFAYRKIAVGDTTPIDEQLSEMIFLGFVAIADPVRPDVEAAIQECMQAGIEVKIVTGDTSATAIEIARQIGLWKATDQPDQQITGSDFAALSDEEAQVVACRIKIMSRARPTDKLRLVKLLQKSANVVAVTGDGTNDAPALNYANVGLSMGSGTSVAKEASDIVLLDDSFNSIVNAVRWGRSLYRNIQRFVMFQLTINVLALIIAFIGPFIGIKLPLTVTQILWVNLIMDTFAALALATEPPDNSVMRNKPRRTSDFIITRAMAKNIFTQAGIFVVALLSLLIWYQCTGKGEDIYYLTIFFTVFVFLQFWNLFNARCMGTNYSAFRHLAQSKPFLMIAVMIAVLQFFIVEFGGALFRTTPLTLRDWLIIIAATSLVLWIGEIRRFIGRMKVKGVAV